MISKPVYYSIYFLVGVMIDRHREALHLHARFGKSYLLLASLLFGATLPLIHAHLTVALSGPRLVLLAVGNRGFPCQTTWSQFPAFNQRSSWGTRMLNECPAEPDSQPIGFDTIADAHAIASGPTSLALRWPRLRLNAATVRLGAAQFAEMAIDKPTGITAAIQAPRSLGDSASLKKLKNQHHDGNNQDEVYETAPDSEPKSQRPHHQQNHYDSPQHKSPQILKQAGQKKSDATEHPEKFHPVGLLTNEPLRTSGAAIYSVFRQR